MKIPVLLSGFIVTTLLATSPLVSADVKESLPLSKVENLGIQVQNLRFDTDQPEILFQEGVRFRRYFDLDHSKPYCSIYAYELVIPVAQPGGSNSDGPEPKREIRQIELPTGVYQLIGKKVEKLGKRFQTKFHIDVASKILLSCTTPDQDSGSEITVRQTAEAFGKHLDLVTLKIKGIQLLENE